MTFDKETNPRTGSPYYAGSKDDVKQFIRSLDLNSDGILGDSNIDERVYYYMDLSETIIDSRLSTYYFTPLLQYNHKYATQNVCDYPAIIKTLSLWIASAMLMESELQQNSPNANEAVEKYKERAEEELNKISTYTYKLPGQRYRSFFSKTIPPTLQPIGKSEK